MQPRSFVLPILNMLFKAYHFFDSNTSINKLYGFSKEISSKLDIALIKKQKKRNSTYKMEFPFVDSIIRREQLGKQCCKDQGLNFLRNQQKKLL